jgi:two-component system KDP operon response regulator KdpE
MKPVIFIVDDESSIRKLLKLSLESAGFSTMDTGSGTEALSLIASHRPKAVILDLGLSDLTGFDVLARLREWSQVPVLILTVEDGDQDKVRALDMGADDYVTKPFSVPELLARLRVALRHARKETSETPIFKLLGLEVDAPGRIVRINDKSVDLTQTEFEILRVLTKHAGRVVTHRLLLNEVWGPNSVEHVQYLRVYIGQIRKKLREAGAADLIPEIRTESGVGYRLVTPD